MTQTEFVTLTDPFRSKLYRLAKRLLVSHEEAEDAVQEVMVKLWSMQEKLAAYRSVEALAMTMGKNYCLDQLKSKRAGNLRIVHNDFPQRAEHQKDLEQADSLDWIEKIMAQLPDQQKMVLQLRDIEQYEFDKIAEIMGITEVTARVTLSRARKTVREQLIKTHQYGIA